MNYNYYYHHHYKDPWKYWDIVNEKRGLQETNEMTEIIMEGEKVRVSENVRKVAQW